MRSPQSLPPTPLPPAHSTCRVVQGQAIIEHVCHLHAVGVVAEGCDAVVSVGAGSAGAGTDILPGMEVGGAYRGRGEGRDTARTQAEPAQLTGVRERNMPPIIISGARGREQYKRAEKRRGAEGDTAREVGESCVGQ